MPKTKPIKEKIYNVKIAQNTNHLSPSPEKNLPDTDTTELTESLRARHQIKFNSKGTAIL